MLSSLLPVSKPAPSGLQRPVLIAAACAVMLLSTRPLLFNMTKRPSLLQISKVSLPLPPPLPRPPNSSQCKSVGIKSSGSLATSTESRFSFNLYKRNFFLANPSSLQRKMNL
uniref:Uncharacterized protein n=1 Tax=Glossina pallidipes TaxID=7398 RepID=A0A1A9ZFI7_GLOPL